MHRNDFDTTSSVEAKTALIQPSTEAAQSTDVIPITKHVQNTEDIAKIITDQLKIILCKLTNDSGNRHELLLSAWLNVQQLIETGTEDLAKWMQYVIKCTLDSMLMNCNQTETTDLAQLKTQIGQCMPLVERYSHIYYRCKYILENIDAPWSHPTLKLIFNDGKEAPTAISDEQLYRETEYLTGERGCMIEMRARKLIESRCERLALNFVIEALRVIQSCTDEHLLRRTVSLGQHQTLLEMYYCLLYKFKELARIKTELEQMAVDSAKEFIINSFVTIDAHQIHSKSQSSRANARKQQSCAQRLHKYLVLVSQYALQLILVRLLGGEYGTNGLESAFQDLLSAWIRRHKPQANFDELFQKLVNTAASNNVAYECCELLYHTFPNNCDTALKLYCSELTKEINVLENKKYDKTVETTTILLLEKQISMRYVGLANLLDDYPAVRRECMLTAFSLNPTKENFNVVCAMAQQNADAMKSETASAETSESNDYDMLLASNRLLDAIPCLSEAVKMDLLCLLRVARIKDLNWLEPWHKLKGACEELIFTEKKKQIVENSTVAANDKLQYLNLNYDDFKDFTPHEYPGIEKGYEVYVADSDSSDSMNGDHGHESDATDSAPESKKFIVKEAKRLRDRKRRQMRRSQILLEKSENSVKVKVDEGDNQQKRKKRNEAKPKNGDTAKPKPKRTRAMKKKSAPAAEKNADAPMDVEAAMNAEPMDVKMETELDASWANGDEAFDCSDNYAPFPNQIQQNSANFPPDYNCFPTTSNTPAFNDHGNQSYSPTQLIKEEPFKDFAALNFPSSNQCDQSNGVTSFEVVNNPVFTEPKNEPDKQAFRLIVEDFDEDEKVSLQFQNIVGKMNFLGAYQNACDITQETISMQPAAMPPAPVITELCPLNQNPIETKCFSLVHKNEKKDNNTSPPGSTYITSPVPKAKPKNPLLTFRKQKKTSPNKPVDCPPAVQSNELLISSVNNELPAAPPNLFNFSGNSIDWVVASSNHAEMDHTIVAQEQPCDTSKLSPDQFNERSKNKQIDTDASSPIVVLTRHCTVRLDRMPKLDMLNSFGPICVKQIKTNYEIMDNNMATSGILDDSMLNGDGNYDHATNNRSSTDGLQSDNALDDDNAQATEEDEDEERAASFLYPYSSLNVSHKNNGHDDDDDCNSSEDSKSSCPSECVGLKTEHATNGQQQQQQQHNSQSNQHERQNQYAGVPQHLSTETLLCARQRFLANAHISVNVKCHFLCDDSCTCPRNIGSITAACLAHIPNNNSKETSVGNSLLTPIIPLAPYSSSTEHINANRLKGMLVWRTISSHIVNAIRPMLANAVFRRTVIKFASQLLATPQRKCRINRRFITRTPFSPNDPAIWPHVCIHFISHWLTDILSLACVLVIAANLIVEMFLLAVVAAHLSNPTAIFKSIYLWKSLQRTNSVASTNECSYPKLTDKCTNEVASEYFEKRKQFIKRQYEANCAESNRFDLISAKSNGLLCGKEPINSVVIVRMVQIILANDTNAPLAQSSSQSNSVESVTQPVIVSANSNGTSHPNGVAVVGNISTPSTAQRAIPKPIISINATANATKHLTKVTKMPVQMNAKFTPKVTPPIVTTNRKSNVIMVKRPNSKNNCNGVAAVPGPVFSSMSVSTPKASDNRSPPAATSVIIMNKLDSTKNGTNNSELSYEVPARSSNHLLRILNAPPKPINSSSLGALPSVQVSDFHKSVKVTTAIANESPVTLTSADNVTNLNHTKLRHLINEQNGNKKLNNSLFICKTEGKVLRLTPLMGSNCFNNVTATVANEIKVVSDAPTIVKKEMTKSPPPLTLAVSSPSMVNATTNQSRSVIDDIYSKFINTKDTQKDKIQNNDNQSKPLIVDESKLLKSSLYSIPSTHTIIPSKQSTFVQRQGGLVKTESINAATAFTDDGKARTKANVQSSPTIYLKQVTKARQPQSKGLCEILLANEKDLKVIGKTGSDVNLSGSPAIASSAMNQIHIFPIITTNGRNVSIAQSRDSVRPQVIITGANASDNRVQKAEPEKRNLVDQLREFDMVMEQIREERNTNEPDKIMLNNLTGILNHHIIDSCQMRSVGLPQKINLAFIKNATATSTKGELLESKASTPVVVVAPKTEGLKIESHQEIFDSIRERSDVTTNQSENVASLKISSTGLKTNPSITIKNPPKSQEDAQTAKRIYDILAQYAEQINSAPDLNNKPAPRRRSNLMTIHTSALASTNMVTSKSSSTVGSIISSSSNSNSSSESYQGASESRKRTFSLQNDEGSDCLIETAQTDEKKRRISNIDTITVQSGEKMSLDGTDYILSSLPKSTSNDLIQTNNQIIITTTNAQHDTKLIPAAIKQHDELGLTNGVTPIPTNLKPLTIGVTGTSAESAKQATQSTILLPGVSVVVSTEQNLQQTPPKIIATKCGTSEPARFRNFTTGFPCKMNITGANKCRPFKQCASGQNYRNENYVMPMGIMKYGKSSTIINEPPKVNQMVHTSVPTVVIPSTKVQRDKVIPDKAKAPEPKIHFNIARKSDNFGSLPTTSAPSTPTLLLRSLSGPNIGGMHGVNKKDDDGLDICEQWENIPFPSQIFQSNHGILILDSNKNATLLTTNTTIPTTTAPVMSCKKSCRNDIKSSTVITKPKITATIASTPAPSTTHAQSASYAFTRGDVKVPICDSDDDFLLEGGLSIHSPEDDDDGDDSFDDSFDDLEDSGRIFSLRALPTLFGGELSKSTEDILNQSDHTDNDVIDDSEEMIYHQNDKSSDNVVIIDKQKSDSLTLNSVSGNTRIARTNNIIERELRLQKSLSEECEDLGVDEPSTSELFPDAFITF